MEDLIASSRLWHGTSYPTRMEAISGGLNSEFKVDGMGPTILADTNHELHEILCKEGQTRACDIVLA